MSKVTTIEKNGFVYSVHQVAIEKGRKHIGEVVVPKPTSDTFQAYIDGKIISLVDVCTKYNTAKAVEMQAEARRAATSTKMSQTEWFRIYNTLDTDILVESKTQTEMSSSDWLNEYIQVIFNEAKPEIVEPEEVA